MTSSEQFKKHFGYLAKSRQGESALAALSAQVESFEMARGLVVAELAHGLRVVAEKGATRSKLARWPEVMHEVMKEHESVAIGEAAKRKGKVDWYVALGPNNFEAEQWKDLAKKSAGGLCSPLAVGPDWWIFHPTQAGKLGFVSHGGGLMRSSALSVGDLFLVEADAFVGAHVEAAAKRAQRAALPTLSPRALAEYRRIASMLASETTELMELMEEVYKVFHHKLARAAVVQSRGKKRPANAIIDEATEFVDACDRYRDRLGDQGDVSQLRGWLETIARRWG